MALQFLNDGYFAGKVGIGTDSPDAPLHIEGTANVPLLTLESSGDTILQINRNDNTIGGGNRTGIIQFGAEGSWGTNLETSKIWSYAEETFTSTANGTSLRFFTTELGATSPTEKMIIDTNGNVGIGTTLPGYKLSVNGTIQSDLIRGYTYPDHSFLDFDYDQTTASNTTSLVSIARVNYISDSNGNDPATSIGHSFMTGTTDIDTATPLLTILNNGNVGIGTTSPSYKLDVRNSGNIFIGITDLSDSTSIFRLRANGGSQELLEIKADGKVGIGTASPSVQLDIEDSSNVIVDMNTTTANANTTIRLQESGTVKATIGYDGTNDGLILTTGGFTAGNGIFIDDSQNVGIGTASPDRKLHVNSGSTNIVATFESTDATAAISLQDNSTTNDSKVQIRAIGDDFNIVAGGSQRVTVNSSGNVGIGTTSPGAKLHISEDSAAQLYLERTGSITGKYRLGIAGANNRFYISDIAQSADRFVINENGNVGIGTDSPTQKLHVAGNARVTGAYYDSNNSPGTANQVLISTVTGTDWVDGSGSSIIGGPYLPLSAGSSYPLTGDLYIPGFIFHVGDIDSYFGFGAPNVFDLVTGGSRKLYADSTAVYLYKNGSQKLRTTTGGITVTGDIQIDSALLSNQNNTDVDTGTETIASVAIATYTAAFFDFVIKKTTNVRSGTVYACHDGTNVEFTETSTQDLGDTSDVTLSVDISGGNMRLRATTTSDDWSVKSLIRAI